MNSFHAHSNLQDKALLDAVEEDVKIAPAVEYLKAFNYLDYDLGLQLIARSIAASDNKRAYFLKQNLGYLNPLVAHFYYLLKGSLLPNINPKSYGFSIQDYLDYQPTVISNKTTGDYYVDLASLKINSLYGLNRLPNIDKLRQINLGHNQIKEIPTNWQGFDRLEQINLNNNQIREIPANWQGLNQLRTLALSNNQIKKIPINWQGLNELRWILLDHNQITEIPRSWHGIDQLWWLNLSFNKIREVPTVLQGLNRLSSLDLSANQINEVNKTMIRNALPNVRINF